MALVKQLKLKQLDIVSYVEGEVAEEAARALAAEGVLAADLAAEAATRAADDATL
jgi:hypothetical protein